jgi:DNA repair exonuclease SbcCD nuclease subunit
MQRALIYSDIHIHPHKRSVDRLEDCLKTLNWVFATAKAKGIKTIIFVGDLFHDRQKIDVLTYQRTFEIFKKHLIDEPDGLTVYLLLGNHDLWHSTKWDVSSVFPLAAMPGVEIIDKPCVKEMFGKQVGFLPYTHDPISDLKGLMGEVLFAHVAIDDALWNVRYNIRSEVAIEHDGDMVKVGPEIFDGWDRVFLGHYHAAQKLTDTVEYVGSPLQLTFGEAFQDKFIVAYDFNSDAREYIKNDFSPKHFIISEEDIPKYDLEGNFIRLNIDDIGSSDIVEMRQELLTKHSPNTLEIKQNPKEVKQHEIEDAKAILYKEEEMLEKYIDEVGINGLDRDLLLEIGKSIIEEENIS